MDLKDFENRLQSIENDLQQAIENDLPDIIGTEAVNHFKEGFLNEGFTDTSLQPWQEVKRRMPGSKAKGTDLTRRILTGRTGMLSESIEYTKSPGKVTVFANPTNQGAGHNYAKVHQYGVSDAGRNRSTTIPARPFLGKSQELAKQINARITRYFSQIINTLLK